MKYFTFFLIFLTAKKSYGDGIANVRVARSTLRHASNIATRSCLHSKSSKSRNIRKSKKPLKDGEVIFIFCLVAFIFSFLFIFPFIKWY